MSSKDGSWTDALRHLPMDTTGMFETTLRSVFWSSAGSLDSSDNNTLQYVVLLATVTPLAGIDGNPADWRQYSGIPVVLIPYKKTVEVYSADGTNSCEVGP